MVDIYAFFNYTAVSGVIVFNPFGITGPVVVSLTVEFGSCIA